MFSKTITNSSRFLMMPVSSQNLYFHLGMNADDDGFCEHFAIMRMVEAKPDDLKILQAKGFVSVFDDRVLVILDWKENNYLRSDRYQPSKYLQVYKQEMAQLSQSRAIGELGIPPVYQLDTQVRLGKVRKGKNTAASAAPATPYSWEETRQHWYDGDKEDFQLLAWFFDKKSLWPKLTSKAKVEAAVKRHIRAARRIIRADWTQDESKAALKKMLEANPKMRDEWTLETLEKYLTK